MTTGILVNAKEFLHGLCDILRGINPNANMAPQAFSQRINRDHAVDLLKTVMTKIHLVVNNSWETGNAPLSTLHLYNVCGNS